MAYINVALSTSRKQLAVTHKTIYVQNRTIRWNKNHTKNIEHTHPEKSHRRHTIVQKQTDSKPLNNLDKSKPANLAQR